MKKEKTKILEKWWCLSTLGYGREKVGEGSLLLLGTTTHE